MITKGQNRMLHGLLNKTKLMDMKPELVFMASQCRTIHSSELTEWEATALINDLKARVPSWENDPLNKARREVFRLCHKLEWKNGDGSVDQARLGDFLKSAKSKIRKPLNKQNAQELSTTIFQLRQILDKQPDVQQK